MTSTSEPTIIELDSDFDDNDIEVIRRGGPSPKTMLRNVWGNKWIWLRVFGNGVMTFLKGVIFQMALFLKVPLLFFIAPFLHLQLCKFPFLRLELLEPVSSLSGCSFLWWFKAFHYFILTQILRRTFRTFWKSSLFFIKLIYSWNSVLCKRVKFLKSTGRLQNFILGSDPFPCSHLSKLFCNNKHKPFWK